MSTRCFSSVRKSDNMAPDPAGRNENEESGQLLRIAGDFELRELAERAGCYLADVSALTGTSMSSLRMTRLVALRVASSKP